MRPTLFAHAALSAMILVGAAACRRPTAVDPLVGTYLATTFQVAPAGQSAINVLAQGGTLGLNLARDPTAASSYIVAGTLALPPAVTGGGAFTASMAGTAVGTGSVLRITQAADTFVRDLTFTLVENRLEATSQTVAGTTYTVVLTRQ
jgi:hypothetical protein